MSSVVLISEAFFKVAKVVFTDLSEELCDLFPLLLLFTMRAVTVGGRFGKTAIPRFWKCVGWWTPEPSPATTSPAATSSLRCFPMGIGLLLLSLLLDGVLLVVLGYREMKCIPL